MAKNNYIQICSYITQTAIYWTLPLNAGFNTQLSSWGLKALLEKSQQWCSGYPLIQGFEFNLLFTSS